MCSCAVMALPSMPLVVLGSDGAPHGCAQMAEAVGARDEGGWVAQRGVVGVGKELASKEVEKVARLAGGAREAARAALSD